MFVQSGRYADTVAQGGASKFLNPQNKKSARGMPRANYYMVIVGTAYRAVNKVFCVFGVQSACDTCGTLTR